MSYPGNLRRAVLVHFYREKSLGNEIEFTRLYWKLPACHLQINIFSDVSNKVKCIIFL